MTLQIETLPTAALTPYARNARTHSPEQVAQIAASIREFGFTNPVLIDAEGGIIAGHRRVTRTELARIANVNRSTVTRWAQNGHITIEADGKIDLQDIPRDFLFARKQSTKPSKNFYASRKDYYRAHRKANPEKYRLLRKKYTEGLSDGYVAALIGYRLNDCPSELIQLKRQQVQIHRLTKQLDQTLQEINHE